MNLLLSMPGGTEFILLFIVLVIPAISFILYILNLQSTLQIISPENRKMRPENVWFLFVPLFGFFWHFYIVKKMSESVKAESLNNNILIKESNPGLYVGYAMCILTGLAFIPNLKIIASLGALVCWVNYWVKINSYKNSILAAKKNSQILSI